MTYEIRPEDITWSAPDPEWEYVEVYNQLQKTKADIETLLAELDKSEGTKEADAQLSDQIGWCMERLSYCRDLLCSDDYGDEDEADS